ncbi:amidohydrolase family protein [Edaphobacter dinghuensis]|uniref:Metal-dependent hydrolase n=2 Tax=Edaphobacter dinghuensis TaxID=1560005 RepID=A0A917HBW2_9BACT|nr:amidohydrolase family protein [Edaphobacter dinghuensis]GGG72998.1 metal-dependent hydrolase [Edaphobacter dinghuensis]
MNRRRFLAASIAATAALPSATSFASTQTQILIDSHVHVWKHDPTFPFAEGAHVPPEDASAEMLLELMKANGVARTVLIQVIDYRWDNSYLASVLKRYPLYFKGVCRVNPEDPVAPDHLSELTEQGFDGVRISPSAAADGDWIRGPLMHPLWRRCAQLKVPMTVLTPVTRLPDLVSLIEQNPELTVVIDHMADSPLDEPKKLELLLALARYPRVFVKISHMWSLSKQAYPYADAAEQVKRLYDRFGAERLMWGTDWPISLKQLSYARAVALFRDHLDFMSAADHEQVLYKTVQQVWPFGL